MCSLIGSHISYLQGNYGKSRKPLQRTGLGYLQQETCEIAPHSGTIPDGSMTHAYRGSSNHKCVWHDKQTIYFTHSAKQPQTNCSFLPNSPSIYHIEITVNQNYNTLSFLDYYYSKWMSTDKLQTTSFKSQTFVALIPFLGTKFS